MSIELNRILIEFNQILTESNRIKKGNRIPSNSIKVKNVNSIGVRLIRSIEYHDFDWIRLIRQSNYSIGIRLKKWFGNFK